MSGEANKSQFVLPLDQPVVSLNVDTAFSQLNYTERMYAHYLSQSAWIGGLITLLQTSPESGPVFVLLHKFFTAQNPSKFRAMALTHGFSEGEVAAVLVYTAGIFTNSGNYKGFGDTKFIPGVEPDRFEQLLKLSPIWSDLQALWYCFSLKERMYDVRQGRTCLGFPPQGCTTYFSSNCDPDDNKVVQDWLKKHNIETYNSRCFKTQYAHGQVEYEIRLASEEDGELQFAEEGKYRFRVLKGDYAPLMNLFINTLEKALPFANQTELYMLQSYMRSFQTGSINDHKQGSRLWVQNKTPSIETYMGFIETYRDPAGVRGEFEAFVAIVNRPMSKKFTTLVYHAEHLLAHLPWPKEFEKDIFVRPDFTSLDVLTFAGSGIPAGINIPNYEDVRQTDGFKNVCLGNVIPASYQHSRISFLSNEDVHLLKKWRAPAFELQVGLHELLGHGSGKLFRQETDGSTNFPPDLLNPVTSAPITRCYYHGDTYDSRFESFGSAYEECRAEAVGLYLSLDHSVLEIFGHRGKEADDVSYVNWLSLVWAGAGRALEMWEPDRGWLQAHAQARFVLTKVLMQVGVVKILQPQRNNLMIVLDRAAIQGPGRNAISHFLLQIQVFKSIGDTDSAKKLFMNLSEVDEPWLSWRSIILAHKQPRNMLIQPNTICVGNNVMLKTYNSNLEGLIHSWLERFPNPEPLYSTLVELARSDLIHFEH